MLEYYEKNDLQSMAKALLDERHNNYIPDELKNNEYSWNISLFVSRILFNSRQMLPLNKQVLDIEIDNYNNSHKTSVDKIKLENKYWIRYIFDEVKIPSLVFSFCRKLYNDQNELRKYSNENNIDENNIDELLFLGYLAKKYDYEDSRPLVIDTKNFNDIYNTFKKIYPNIKTKREVLKLLKTEKIRNQPVYQYKPSHIKNLVFDEKLAYYIWKDISAANPDITESIKKWAIMLEQFGGADFVNLLNDKEQENFLDNAITLILKEKDLILDEKNEYKKIICDLTYCSCCEDDVFLTPKKRIFEINYNDYFLMWITDKSSDAGYELLCQNCRVLYLPPLMSLLYTKNYSEYIYQLLSNDKKRPFIFSQLLYHLKNNNPEYLLDFIDEEDYGLVFYITFIECCLNKIISPQNEFLGESIIVLLKKTIDIFVDKNFRSYPFRYKQFSRILMWIGQFNFQIDRRPTIIKIKKEIYNYHKELLQKYFLSLKQISDFQQLIDNFHDEKDYILPMHNDIGISQFSYFFNILEIAKKQENKTASDLIVNELKVLYTENILHQNKLFLTREYKQIEDYDWSLFYDPIFDKNEIQCFCNKAIESYIVTCGKELDSFYIKHTNADKFKFLLKTLCLAYQKCRNNKKNYEEIILGLLIHCFRDDLVDRSVNIFSSLHESTFNEEANTSIFPELIEIVNTFTKDGQIKFIKFVLENGSFRLLFKAYNLITFEAGHNQIEEFIKNSDFSTKIDEIYTIPDFIEIVTNVTNSRISDKFEKLLFEELNSIIAKKAKEGYISQYTYQAERLKLFHFYKIKDIESLKSYQFPFKDEGYKYFEHKGILKSDKLFYTAMLNMEDKKYFEALHTLDYICKEFPNNLQYTIYKIYVKSYTLDGDKNRENRNNLLKDIESFEKEGIQNIELLLFVKLKIYILNKDYDLALYFYQSLNSELRSNIDFSYLIINALVEKKQYKTALEIFNSINSRFIATKEYNDLKSLFPINLLLPELQNSYFKILASLSSEKRFMVLPYSINEHNQNLGEYILNEIKWALHRILKKIDLIQKISATNLSEDNISDLVELEMNGRLSMLGYKLENQDRSGKSATGKNAGELDLEISFNDFSIVIEAVKYSRGAAERKKHIEKTFKYDPSIKYIYNLIYFDANNEDFTTAWKNIKKDIDEASYPSAFKKTNTEELESNNAGIKIIKSEHENGLIYYHIMGNFKYAEDIYI